MSTIKIGGEILFLPMLIKKNRIVSASKPGSYVNLTELSRSAGEGEVFVDIVFRM